MTRTRSVGSRLLILTVLVLGGLLVSSGTALAAEVRARAEISFVDKVNAERRARGLGSLTIDTQLTRIARNWSIQMASANRLYHRPDLGRQVAGDWRRLGENVGHTRASGATEQELVDRLHRAFMSSSGHRSNVLGDYSHIGVGVRRGSDGTLWVTVNFMKAPPRRGLAAVGEGVRASRALFANAGGSGRQANRVVLARSDLFADSLGGMALAGDGGPMLFTTGPTRADPQPILHPSTRAEIDRILRGSGTVYLLGGERAVSGRVADELRRDGYAVRRLAGDDRVATSLAIARELRRLHGDRPEVLIATSRDWADAVTAGAYAARAGMPVLLTPQHRLDPRVARFLDETGPAQRWAIGGRAALADSVVSAAQARRVAGPDRFATSVAIAEQLWGRSSGSPGDKFIVTHGRSGWGTALANGPRAAIHQAPQLLVDDRLPDSVRAYLRRLGYSAERTATVEALGVNGTVRSQLIQLTGGA